MTDSGLEEILNSSFGGVPNMLAGKRFPQNFRALRIVVEELLRFSSLQAIVTMRGMLHTTCIPWRNFQKSAPMLHERGTCDGA